MGKVNTTSYARGTMDMLRSQCDIPRNLPLLDEGWQEGGEVYGRALNKEGVSEVRKLAFHEWSYGMHWSQVRKQVNALRKVDDDLALCFAYGASDSMEELQSYLPGIDRTRLEGMMVTLRMKHLPERFQPAVEEKKKGRKAQKVEVDA